MKPALAKNNEAFVPLKQAALMLGVSVDMLLEWNSSNILKPIITQDGKVGYTKDQLNKFISIQQSIQKNNNTNLEGQKQPAEVHDQNTIIDRELKQFDKQVSINDKDKNDDHNDTLYVNGGAARAFKSNKTKLRQPFFISSFLLILIILTLVSVAQQNSPGQSSDLHEVGAVSESEIRGIGLSGSSTPTRRASIQGDFRHEENLKVAGLTTPNNEVTTHFWLIETDPGTSSDEHSDQLVPMPIDLLVNEFNETNGTNVKMAGIDQSINNVLASRPNLTSNSSSIKSLFDENSKIAEGTIAENALATTLGISPQSSQFSNQSKGLHILLASIPVIMLWILYISNKRFAYATPSSGAPMTPNPANNVHRKKVFEIDQKTDGAVVLIFEGNEYKISKPEFNSETDRFIERLIKLTEDVNKIRYDILKDDALNLNAPLSKLVTRLGFVGMKRDLFFPRTSKSKVLFRRHITEQDLNSMDIDANQIIKEFIN